MSIPLPVIDTADKPSEIPGSQLHDETPTGRLLEGPFSEESIPYSLNHATVRNMERETGRLEHVTADMPRPVTIPYANLPRPVRYLKHALWVIGHVARHGWPRDMYYMDGGIGDEVAMTAVFRELVKRGQPPVRMMTAYPELYANNPDVGQLLPNDPRVLELHRLTFRRTTYPIYIYEHVYETDTLVVPPYPLIARMCRKAEISGEVSLRPYMYLTDDEKREGRVARRQVAVVTSGMTAKYNMRNKQWYPERYQAVVEALRGEFDFVQVGDARDPSLDGVLDLRGKTSLRQTAAVLSQSLTLITHEGMLMHLARAVDCRAVVIYGGRTHPYQIGYGAANENLYTPLPCSPCLKRNTCDFDRLCMQKITPEMVAEAVIRSAQKHGTPLPVETYTIVNQAQPRD